MTKSEFRSYGDGNGFSFSGSMRRSGRRLPDMMQGEKFANIHSKKEDEMVRNLEMMMLKEVVVVVQDCLSNQAGGW